MAGFRSVSEWVAAYENGQHWSVILRKGVTQAVNDTSRWIDWMYLGGNPSANYYASSPLVAATVDTGVRPYIPAVSPASQYIKTLSVMQYGTNTGTVSAYGGRWCLCDYLLYYPFVDFTAVGESQDMNNSVTLPRYTDGKGVQMMLICQSSVVGNGQMTIIYINQDGVQKTTPTFFIAGTAFAGQVCSASLSAQTILLGFVPLAAGDSGVRSVVSANVTVDGGGIGAIVLVKPLHLDFNAAASFRAATSPDTSYGSCTQIEFVKDKTPIRIYDGCHLGFVGMPSTGETRYSNLLAHIETIWN